MKNVNISIIKKIIQRIKWLTYSREWDVISRSGFEESFFLAMPHGMWALSSPNRDGIHAPCIGSRAQPLDTGEVPEGFLKVALLW